MTLPARKPQGQSMLLPDAREHGSTASDLRRRPLSAWYAPIERLLTRATHEVRGCSRCSTPTNAQGGARATHRRAPRGPAGLAAMDLQPPGTPHDDLRRALDAAESILERGELSPVETLFLERTREPRGFEAARGAPSAGRIASWRASGTGPLSNLPSPASLARRRSCAPPGSPSRTGPRSGLVAGATIPIPVRCSR